MDAIIGFFTEKQDKDEGKDKPTIERSIQKVVQCQKPKAYRDL